MTIRSFFSSSVLWIRTHKSITILLLFLAGGGIYSVTRPAPLPTWETASVTRGTVLQEVSVTGTVVPSNKVDLAIERGGRIVLIGADVGDRVPRGKVLLKTDSSEIETLLEQAKANLAYEVAKLDELKKGARPEDIRVSEAGVASASVARDDALRALRDKLADAYTKTDDVIFNKTDELLRNPKTTYPEINFPLSDGKLAVEIQNMRVTVGGDMTTWSTLAASLESADASTAANATKKYLSDVKAYLDKLAAAVYTVQTSTAVSGATADSWKASVSTARTTISAAISSVLAAETAYRAAESSFSVAEDQLALKRSGATPEQIAAQEARIAASRASVANYASQIAKFSITAPFAGVVTRQDGKRGGAVPSGASLVTMEGGQATVEANIPEVDIAKVKISDSAVITLDAYGSDVKFPASVIKIDPAETVVEGIPTYKVTFRFADTDERIRSGMTANIDVETAAREDVLMVPSRALYTVGTERYVRISEGATTTERVITVGLRGSNGMVEVLTGLVEGESVVTFLGE